MATQKSSSNLVKLQDYVNQSSYIDISKQPLICNHFGLHYRPSIFRSEYRLRFYNYLLDHTTTVATISKATKIPEKFLCHCKAYYEKRNMVEVVAIGICPTTGSNNVQFLSTNESLWGNFKLNTNQLNLF